MQRSEWLRTPKGLHYVQKCRAKQRGIPFKLTFEEWLEVWGYCLPYRGKQAGQLCMCREGDSGAYELGNVYIGTIEHNTRTADGRKKRNNAKITQEIADEIRAVLDEGITIKECVDEYGISRQSINDIKAGRTWRL